MLRIKGIYDGQKVVLSEPVTLPPNTAVEVVVADPVVEQEQAYWQRLIAQGLIKAVRPGRRAPRQAPAPAQVIDAPISETIIADRR
jgi:hypothetical protein